MTYKLQINSIICIIFSLLIIGCGVYSFTGVAITAQTISIKPFFNDSNNGPPDLGQIFTNDIRDFYLQNTNLTLVEENGELLIEGFVVNYSLTPVAPVAGNNGQADLADLTRLTITVNVSYTNTKDESFDFENKKFSFYSDFDTNENITSIENRLIDEIFEQIILDIFNSTVANW